MKFEAGDLLIIDRAYIDYAWLYSLHRQKVWFVTRLKTTPATRCWKTGKSPRPKRCWPIR
jgi:hypothetical protein